MTVAVSALLIAATLAFGAVYPWGYVPLFAGALLVGAAGALRRPRLLTDRWPIAFGLLSLILAAGVQLISFDNGLLAAVSPHVERILRAYSLGYAAHPTSHPFSVDPANSALAFGALTSLSVYVAGGPGVISPRMLRSLPRNLIIFAVPLALFGIVSRQSGNGLVYWFWHPLQHDGSNLFGPFINRNHFGGWMLMAVCLSLGYWLGQLERIRTNASHGPAGGRRALASTDFSILLLSGAAIVTMAVALIWTLSRSAIIGFCVAVGCFTVLIVRRRTATRGARILSAAAVLIVLLAGVSWRGIDRLAAWYSDTADLHSRFAAWRDGWQVVRDFPLVGTGLNTYGVAMLFYQKSNAGFHLGSAHNDYLQILAEGGLLIAIPAAIAIIALAAAIRRNLVASSHESRGYWIRAGAAVGLLAIGVQEIAEFSLQIPANAFLFCTLAAIALAPIEHHLPKGPVAMRSTR